MARPGSCSVQADLGDVTGKVEGAVSKSGKNEEPYQNAISTMSTVAAVIPVVAKALRHKGTDWSQSCSHRRWFETFTIAVPKALLLTLGRAR